MNSILEALYNNKLAPDSRQAPKDPAYPALGQKLDAALAEWRAKLSDDDYEKLIELFDLHGEIHQMETTSSFVSGFTLGASILMEVYQGQRGLTRPQEQEMLK